MLAQNQAVVITKIVTESTEKTVNIYKFDASILLLKYPWKNKVEN